MRVSKKRDIGSNKKDDSRRRKWHFLDFYSFQPHNSAWVLQCPFGKNATNKRKNSTQYLSCVWEYPRSKTSSEQDVLFGEIFAPNASEAPGESVRQTHQTLSNRISLCLSRCICVFLYSCGSLWLSASLCVERGLMQPNQMETVHPQY